MEIRRATTDDAAIISELNREVQQLHAEALPHLFKPASGGAFPPAEIAGLMADPRNHFFIATAGGEPVGYVYAQVVSRPETSYRYAHDMVYIHHVAVRSACHGQGHGRRLIEAVLALARAQGIRRVELDVWAFNSRARAVFRRMGLEVFNERMGLDLPDGA